jgi:oligoribonuclease (3'-5' exoribonuclease)
MKGQTMLNIPSGYPISPLLGKKLLASVEHLMDATITHNRDVDVACLTEWLRRHEPTLIEYKAKDVGAEIVEPLENSVRLVKAAISCA